MATPKLRFSVFQKSWACEPIKKITTYVDYRGKTPQKTDSGIFLVTAKNIRMGYIDYENSREFIAKNEYASVMSRGTPALGDVLITTEAPMGNIASVDREDIALAQRVIKLRGNEGVLENSFLKYRLQSKKFQSDLKAKSSGGTVKGIKGSTLHKMEIYFPEIEEQRKIASFLASIDSKIHLLTKKYRYLAAYKKGVMQKIFTQKVRFEKSGGGSFADWRIEKLYKLVKSIGSGGTPKSTIKEYYGGDIPWVSIADMTKQGKWINHTQKCITQLGLENSSARLFPSETILYAMYASIGEVSIAKMPCSTSQAILGLQVNTDLINGGYLYFWLYYIKDKAILLGQHGTQANLNLDIVKNFEIAVPDIDEQIKVANFLTALDNKIANIKNQLELTKQYKQGLLQQMFI